MTGRVALSSERDSSLQIGGPISKDSKITELARRLLGKDRPPRQGDGASTFTVLRQGAGDCASNDIVSRAGPHARQGH